MKLTKERPSSLCGPKILGIYEPMPCPKLFPRLPIILYGHDNLHYGQRIGPRMHFEEMFNGIKIRSKNSSDTKG